jgi:hypothetical protein
MYLGISYQYWLAAIAMAVGSVAAVVFELSFDCPAQVPQRNGKMNMNTS